MERASERIHWLIQTQLEVACEAASGLNGAPVKYIEGKHLFNQLMSLNVG